ncbi:MAG: acetamidase/formamidase family protein [SAR202 cluster bacterium]|nr:acetamidase/formamidase family protein [SAR202 cluster bacterium]
MKSVTIDRDKRLRDEPHTGHNRWHPDVPPIVEVAPGEEVVLETRDASDGQIKPNTTEADFDSFDTKVSHPLTGPVYVQGAKPGDLLEIEYVNVEPQSRAWTRVRPGSGFLRDIYTEPYLAHWNIADGWATSPQIPGVRIPNGSFMGTAGLAPSHDQLREWTRREADLVDRGDTAAPPDPEDAVPSEGPVANDGARTIPPRENCGNADAKQLTTGSKLFVPVAVKGALYSAGDGHFAQGDSECCITAIEMGATVTVRFKVHEGEAAAKNIRFPRFAHPGYFLPPEWAAPRNFIATMGFPIRDDGTNESEDVALAARHALLNMIRLLQERGYSAVQAYVICSVVVDLKISNIVDLPNVTVSAFLPEGIFVWRKSHGNSEHTDDCPARGSDCRWRSNCVDALPSIGPPKSDRAIYRFGEVARKGEYA